MKKLAIPCIAIVLFSCVIVSCSTEDTPATETQVPTITTANALSSPISTTKEEVSLSFPEEFTIRTGTDGLEWGFERLYRYSYYGINLPIDSISQADMNDWIHYDQNKDWRKRTEPMLLSLIKYFNVTFEVIRNETQELYLSRRDNPYINLADEEREIPNPYLLYTFDLERINDYYSLDPARNASARQWLEEWLQTNEPYESYSAFMSANPQ